MRVLTVEVGQTTVEPRSEPEASVIGRYWNAVGAFLATGDVEVLAPFVGVIVGDHILETDPDVIEAFGGEPDDWESIYRESER